MSGGRRAIKAGDRRRRCPLMTQSGHRRLQERRSPRYDAHRRDSGGRMRRRDFTVLLVGGTAMRPLRIYAQQARKIPRIGVLLPGGPAVSSPRTRAFLDGLNDHGYVEGRTIAIEWKWGDDRVDAFPERAAELVRSNVDAIVTGGT